MRLRRIIPALFLFVSAQAHAGAWTMPKGEGLFIGQATYFTSQHFYDLDGERIDQPTYRKFELQPYAEYGVRDWLTVGGSAYVHRVDQSSHYNAGVGDPELWARLRLKQFDDGAVLSVQPLIKLPSYYVDDDTPRGGSRSTDLELSILYGRNWELFGITGYSDTRVGYRIRSRGLNKQYRIDQAWGVNVTEHFMLIPAFRAVLASAYDENAIFAQDGEQDYDLAKIELTALYKFEDNRWVHATMFDHVAGAFTGDGRGFMVGFAEPF